MTYGMAHWRPFWGQMATQDIAASAGRSNYGPRKVEILVRATIERLRLRQDDALLDIGCANGLLGEPLSRVCPRYVGVDYVPDMVAWFRKRCGARLCCGSATALPFRDSAFTRSLMMGVLQFLTQAESETALREMRRVTVTGGRALIGCVVVVPVPEVGNKVTSWIREELEALVLRCGWSNPEWMWLDQELHPSMYHRDLAVEAA